MQQAAVASGVANSKKFHLIGLLLSLLIPIIGWVGVFFYEKGSRERKRFWTWFWWWATTSGFLIAMSRASY